jgi:peroxiredoxin
MFMSKTLSLLVLVIVFSTNSFSQAQKRHFEINGNLSGFTEGTLLYLDDVTTSSHVPIDSTIVIDNHFHFSGSLQENVLNVLIRTSDFSNYKFLWLENSTIIFNAEKGKFRDAKVTGSKTQNEADQLSSAVQTSGNEKETSIAFIRSHPNSIVSANILSIYAPGWGKDTAATLYHTLSDKMKNTSYEKDILEFITLNKTVKIGDKYIDFTEPNVEGKNISLSDYDGKIILLEFWGSWCGPCRKGNPELVKIYNEFKSAGFEILGVAADGNKDDWTQAVQKDGLTWQNVTDLKGDKNKAVLIYGISYFPANFLIDKQGVIIAKDLRGDALKSRLQKILLTH